VQHCLKILPGDHTVHHNIRYDIRIAMATILPPKAKRVKREELQRAQEQHSVEVVPENSPNVVVHLRASDTGNQLGGELHIPGNATVQQLDQLVNKLLETVRLVYGWALPSTRSHIRLLIVLRKMIEYPTPFPSSAIRTTPTRV
jgi:hypothetical protein